MNRNDGVCEIGGAPRVDRIGGGAQIAVRIKKDFVALHTLAGGFKTESGLYSEAAHVNGIHKISRRDPLDEVVVVRIRVLRG